MGNITRMLLSFNMLFWPNKNKTLIMDVFTPEFIIIVAPRTKSRASFQET